MSEVEGMKKPAKDASEATNAPIGTPPGDEPIVSDGATVVSDGVDPVSPGTALAVDGVNPAKPVSNRVNVGEHGGVEPGVTGGPGITTPGVAGPGVTPAYLPNGEVISPALIPEIIPGVAAGVTMAPAAAPVNLPPGTIGQPTAQEKIVEDYNNNVQQ